MMCTACVGMLPLIMLRSLHRILTSCNGCVQALIIWRNNGRDQLSAKRLVQQLQAYKAGRAPFNLAFKEPFEPEVWWSDLPQTEETDCIVALAVQVRLS